MSIQQEHSELTLDCQLSIIKNHDIKITGYFHKKIF